MLIEFGHLYLSQRIQICSLPKSDKAIKIIQTRAVFRTDNQRFTRLNLQFNLILCRLRTQSDNLLIYDERNKLFSCIICARLCLISVI